MKITRANMRMKFGFFMLFGIVFLIFAWSWNRNPAPHQVSFWIPCFIDIGTVFLGVGLIKFVWDYLGGEPDGPHNLYGLVKQVQNMGVVDFWLSRIKTTGDRREKYLKYIKNSERIDLMGLNLATEIFDVEDVKSALVDAINHNTKVRVLISEPNIEKSKITQQRLSEPGESKDEVVFPNLLGKAQEGISDIYFKLRKQKGAEFLNNIRLAYRSVIYCMVIRIDEQMFVCNYLSSIVGNETPGMQISKSGGTGLFDKYTKEFEIAWHNARDLSSDERKQLVQLSA